MMGLFGRCIGSERSNVAGVTAEVTGRVMARPSTYPGGRGGKERVASLRAEQRLAPGGGAPCPGAVNYTNVNNKQATNLNLYLCRKPSDDRFV